jgi:acyl-coenzyme A synthetase/AMP-(fatty) acid ligase/3-hydroxymyristoyl/3-hydroxydecanoyl-(acyl carrier protein) dehydratase
MSETVDLLSLLTAARSDDTLVGWRNGQRVRYDVFCERVRVWRALLARAKGRRFALYIGDSVEFACALLGAWQADKRIYLPADTLVATCTALAREVDGFLGEFGAQWTPLLPVADNAVVDTDDFKTLAPDFVGLVIYTSGSSGAAQAIPKHLSQLAAEVDTLEQLFGAMLGSADIVATVSHQHIYGLLFKVLWPLAAGRAIHARSLEFPEQLAQVLETRECVFISSPAHLKRLPDLPGWELAPQRLRAVFSSGGPLLFDVGQEAARLLRQMPVEVYGSSETGGIAWRQRHTESDERWTPMPGVAWRITPAEGVLEVRSRHLPDGAWFQLADSALAADGDGFVLRGRVDRIIKIEEKRISLDAIESRLAASPLVADVRVLVMDGRRQRIGAFVVPSHEGCSLLGEVGKLAFNRLLNDTLAGTVERIALPRIWCYLDALPLNTQGKTTHADLLALLGVAPVRSKLPRQRLLEKETLRAVYELIAPRDLFYFDGHFPDAPILPGVAQIDWAIAYGRQCFSLPPVFKSIQALKFQRVIHPELPVTLELVHEPVKSCLTFRFSSRDGQHASGRVVFGASDV